MSERSGGQLVVDQLTKEGVQTVFCVPGESYLQVLDALHIIADMPVIAEALLGPDLRMGDLYR